MLAPLLMAVPAGPGGSSSAAPLRAPPAVKAEAQRIMGQLAEYVERAHGLHMQVGARGLQAACRCVQPADTPHQVLSTRMQC